MWEFACGRKMDVVYLVLESFNYHIPSMRACMYGLPCNLNMPKRHLPDIRHTVYLCISYNFIPRVGVDLNCTVLCSMTKEKAENVIFISSREELSNFSMHKSRPTCGDVTSQAFCFFKVKLYVWSYKRVACGCRDLSLSWLWQAKGVDSNVYFLHRHYRNLEWKHCHVMDWIWGSIVK